MSKSRLEAFSDGVIAILITIMVLELSAPEEVNLAALWGVAPVFLSYVLSFIYLGIYWVNHHHLFQVVERIDGRVLWANLHLLFWLSLVSFATAWLGESGLATWPVALYGLVLLAAAIAYYILTRSLLAIHAPDSPLALALGRDFKGRVSIVIYITAILLAFVSPLFSCGLFVLVALIWVIPDRRMEKRMGRREQQPD